VAGVVIVLVVLLAQNRALSRDLVAASATAEAARELEQELTSTVARQHSRLQKTEGELEMIRLQMEAVEMQLDGVDYLSRQIREELELPPSPATWTDAEDGEPAQGGAYMATEPDRQRLTLIQRRLAAGLAELYQLQELSLQRSESIVSEPEPVVSERVEPADPSPANWPARGQVSSSFGWRLFRGRPNYHTGIDVSMPYGTQVMATGDGTVVGSGWQPGYGWSVLVQHDAGFNTLYAQLVGLSGSSGNSTGPHLHYEIWRDGQPLDPRPYMDGTTAR
jgi:murein DD-endopeptidase MepM/ murein hydrolase activator NlpD